MARFVKYVPCPDCRAIGHDRTGDNLAIYDDGSAHCFARGHHRHAKGLPKRKEVNDGPANEGVLPLDFTRDVPAAGWKWLLQYGLPYSYWKPYTGYSPSTERLILTHGNPTELSVGRYIGNVLSSNDAVGDSVRGVSVRSNDGQTNPTPRKWRQWGDKLRSATILEPSEGGSKEGLIVLVEDLVSAHKVRQAGYACLPLFGNTVYPKVLQVLRPLKRSTRLWLDLDQWGVLPPKLNRLQAFLEAPVGFVKTDKDPKSYGTDEIRTILGLRND